MMKSTNFGEPLAKGFSLIIIPDPDDNHGDEASGFVATALNLLNSIKLKPALVFDCGNHLRASWFFDSLLRIIEIKDQKRIFLICERLKHIFRCHEKSEGIGITGKRYYFENEYKEGEVILKNENASYSLEDFENYFVEHAIKKLSNCRISLPEGCDPWSKTLTEE